MDISISNIIAIGSSIIALGSLVCSYFSLKTSKENNTRNLELSEKIAKQETEMTKEIAKQHKEISEKEIELSKQIFKRQGVIELHNAWKDVNEINPKSIIGPDVKKAANALSLTSSLWNHDIIAKEILFDHYWDTFKELYDTLKASNDDLVPGYKKTCKQFLSDEMFKAYKDMENMAKSKVSQTKL